GGEFMVALIPLTLADTTLGQRRAGDVLNIEYDILGKYVARWLAHR
ncbi:riboflavin synthase, partial [bacterium]|nr:riboflavin synthase [candidate division CSSED10-310 bacterium]